MIYVQDYLLRPISNRIFTHVSICTVMAFTVSETYVSKSLNKLINQWPLKSITSKVMEVRSNSIFRR